MRNDVTVAILAGGLSRRMGTNKSFVLLAGKPLIEHVIERVSALRLPVLLITNTPEQYAQFELPMYGDVYPQRGSMGGLYTALHYSLTDYTLCVACDMPFLSLDLLRYMLDLRSGVDSVVPYIAGNYESLHAIYHRTCLPVIREQLVRGRLRIHDIYIHLQVRLVTELEIERIDPDQRSFANLNTPDDVAHIQKWLP
ncbi:MAG: molybdenum cofactor guanylyltransferase [Chloroflexi bacterium]|nr:molybdenum cofactor guanylyltransferase [Chloroflexota bacterium]